MTAGRRTQLLAAVAAAVLLFLLATCGGGDDEPAPRASADPTADATSEPSDEAVGQLPEPAASIEGDLQGGRVRLDVQPLVRTGAATVLTAELTVLEAPDSGSLTVGSAFAARGQGSGTFDLSDVRLFAPDGGLLASPAEVGGEAATTSLSRAPGLEQDQRAGLRVVFPELPATVDTADVLWPLLGTLTGLPIQDGELPELPPFGDEDEPRDVEADGATGEALPVAARSSELAGAVRTEAAPERTLVVLAADVLFALDSADLSEQARAAIDRAAAQVHAAGPGPVQVTGHTDDQGSDAYNRDLSNRRAQAVADALAAALPPDQYPPQVQGLGEQQPAVEGTSVEARAANRRVELLVERPQEQEATPVAAEPPPGGGPSVPGAEGIAFPQSDGGVMRIAAGGAEREGEWLRVDLSATVEAVEGDTTDMLVDLRDTTRRSLRADASGVGVLDGGTLLLPAVVEDGPCACANTLFGLSAELGERRSFSVYVQAPTTSGSTVTVQLPKEQGRLLDVPVA